MFMKYSLIYLEKSGNPAYISTYYVRISPNISNCCLSLKTLLIKNFLTVLAT